MVKVITRESDRRDDCSESGHSLELGNGCLSKGEW